MAMTQRLELRHGQTLTMTPQLQQAIKLLTLTNIELQAYVEQELVANPLLEASDGADERHDGPPRDAAGSAAPAPPADDGAWAAGGIPQWAGATGARSAGFDGEPRGLEETLSDEVDLRRHLLSQLATDVADPGERRIGVYLIDMLDEAGYLVGDLAQAAELLGCPAAQVEVVLAKLQQCDPPGIFARTLKECLALQLRDRNRLDPAMQALLDNLHLLANRDRAALLKVCGVDAEDLADMAAEIRALDPKPALAFDRTVSQAVTPDVLVHRHPDGGWIVELNNETLPRVLVNRAYFARVRRAVRGKAEREYVIERYRAANWLVKSLHQRATTILKVATEIVGRQDGFLRHGVHDLKPLARRDIAAAIGMHESTVSRATAGKFMATPRGVYEFAYFFGSAIADAGGGAGHAAEAVRSRIKELIAAEAAEAVLSDDRLVSLLRGEGIDIARRTVAKYRESMKIHSSPQRRRDKTLRI